MFLESGIPDEDRAAFLENGEVADGAVVLMTFGGEP